MKKDINMKCITNKCKQCKDYLKCFEYKPGRKEDEKKMDKRKRRRVHKKGRSRQRKNAD